MLSALSHVSDVILVLSDCCRFRFCFFFFNDTATTEIYTLSLHDALPISCARHDPPTAHEALELSEVRRAVPEGRPLLDRKSTRLNSSHSQISYAVFCLKKKTISQ